MAHQIDDDLGAVFVRVIERLSSTPPSARAPASAARAATWSDRASLADTASTPIAPLPTGDVVAWWTDLAPGEQDAVVTQRPELVGAADGLPGWARDRANRILLDRAEADLTRQVAALEPPARTWRDLIGGAGGLAGAMTIGTFGGGTRRVAYQQAVAKLAAVRATRQVLGQRDGERAPAAGVRRVGPERSRRRGGGRRRPSRPRRRRGSRVHDNRRTRPRRLRPRLGGPRRPVSPGSRPRGRPPRGRGRQLAGLRRSTDGRHVALRPLGGPARQRRGRRRTAGVLPSRPLRGPAPHRGRPLLRVDDRGSRGRARRHRRRRPRGPRLTRPRRRRQRRPRSPAWPRPRPRGRRRPGGRPRLVRPRSQRAARRRPAQCRRRRTSRRPHGRRSQGHSGYLVPGTTSQWNVAAVVAGAPTVREGRPPASW